MKKYFFILALLIICGNAFGQIEAIEKEPVEKTKHYYVYFTRTEGFQSGVKGELVDIVPVDKIIPPEHDYLNFCLVKMELTDEEYKKMIENKEQTIINNTVTSDSKNVKTIKDISFKSLAIGIRQ